MKSQILFFLFVICFGSLSSGQVAEQAFWHILKPNQKITETEVIHNWYQNKTLTATDSLKLIQSKVDQYGVRHHTYQQYHKGVKLENGLVSFHAKDNHLFLYNGQLQSLTSINVQPAIQGAQAIQMALDTIKADTYAWEDDEYVQSIRMVTQDKVQDLYPVPDLIIGADEQSRPKLYYKMEVHALKPQGKHLVYVDAITGVVAQHIEITNHVTGACGTIHHGTQDIDFDSPVSGVYELSDNTRSIETYLMSNGTYSSAQIPTSTVLDWSNLLLNDRAVLDVHWATEVVFDFLNANGINSYDDAGALIRNYVNFGTNYNTSNNAFWNGFFLTYGSGGGSTFPDPLVTLDVIGHEFAHALTQHYGGELYYFGESGAINESISDMIGALVEIHVNNASTFNGLTLNEWVMSDLNGVGIRDLSNPSAFNQPDTYQGANWLSTTSSFDNGGVHFNSGVGNYWFYLLANGGVGVNDNGDAYNVSPLSISDLTSVVLESYHYMNPNASYLDFRNATIAAVHLLFNDCTKTQKVIDAWNAVGVGDPNEGCPNVLFGIESNRSQYCQGDMITFSNAYVNSPSYTYSWRLDGAVVNMPVTFTSAGVSTLELVVVENATGLESTDELALYISNCQPIDSDKGIWYFGYKRGFDFNTGIAELTSYPWINFETTHCYSRNGEIEYYVTGTPNSSQDGEMEILDKNHSLIANISPIYYSSQQIGASALSPTITSNHHYVNLLLNASHDAPAGNISGLYKVVLNIVNPGSPVFVSMDPVPPPVGANADIFGAVNSRESTVIIPGCNPYIYWVLIGSQNSGFGMSIFKLDYGPITGSPTGDLTFVSHTVGGDLTRTKLVAPNGNYFVVDEELYAFDRVNGISTLLATFPPNGGGPRGAFSPNSQYYYTSEDNKVYQYDVLAADFAGSQVYLGDAPTGTVNSSYNLSAQLGPDDKVYLAFRGPHNGWAPETGQSLIDSPIAVVNAPNNKDLNGESLYNPNGYYLIKAFVNSFRPNFPSFSDAKVAAEEPITLTVDQVNCMDVTLMAPSCKAFYSWGFGDGDTLAMSTSSVVTHTYQNPGTYTISISSHFNGVDTTVYETIEVGFTDSVGIIAPDSICNSGFNMVQGTPGYAYYSWSVISGSAIISNPSSTSSITGVTWQSTGPVVLALTITDLDGCSTTVQKTIQVAGGDVPPIPNAAVLDTVFAECRPVNIEAPMATGKCGGAIIGTTTDLPVNTIGTTIVTWTYTDDDGFDTTQQQVVIITPIDNTVSQAGNLWTSNANGNYTYQWIDCSTNLPVTGATNQSFLPPQSGSYAVEVSNGECSVVSECFEHIGLGVSVSDPGFELTLYPNPAKSVLNVLCDAKFRAEIYNDLGEKVMITSEKTIDISKLPIGVYYVNFYTVEGELMVSKKVIKH